MNRQHAAPIALTELMYLADQHRRREVSYDFTTTKVYKGVLISPFGVVWRVRAGCVSSVEARGMMLELLAGEFAGCDAWLEGRRI